MKKTTFPALVLLSVLLVVGCDRKERSVEKPKETITLERAHAMYNAYQERFRVLTDFRGEEDASFGWHSLEFYKNYIAYLENAAKKVDMEVSGLRTYYVAYPKDQESGKQADYQTYILVPTYYDKKTNTHIAFDPLHMDENGNPKPIHEIITRGMEYQKTGKATSLLTGGYRLVAAGTESSIANMAQMCKPNCDQ